MASGPSVAFLLSYVLVAVGVVVAMGAYYHDYVKRASGARVKAHGTPLYLTLIGIVALVYVMAYAQIFSDHGGDGDMFTYEGMLTLMETKGDMWRVGVWTEVIAGQLMVVLYIYGDSLRQVYLPHPLLVVACMAACVLMAGAGFFGYLAVKIMYNVLLWRGVIEPTFTRNESVAVATAAARRERTERYERHSLEHDQLIQATP